MCSYVSSIKSTRSLYQTEDSNQIGIVLFLYSTLLSRIDFEYSQMLRFTNAVKYAEMRVLSQPCLLRMALAQSRHVSLHLISFVKGFSCPCS